MHPTLKLLCKLLLTLQQIKICNKCCDINVNFLKWPLVQQTYDLRLYLILILLFLDVEAKPSNDLLGHDQSMFFTYGLWHRCQKINQWIHTWQKRKLGDNVFFIIIIISIGPWAIL